MFKKLEICKKMIYINYYKNKITKDSNWVKFVKRMLLKPIASFITAQTIINYACKEDYNTAISIGNMVWCYGKVEKIPKDYYDNLIEVEFENIKFKRFKEYNQYLSQVYGDYMQLPPVEKEVERDKRVRMQTPHAFSLKTLYNMHIKANEKQMLNTSASGSLAINLGIKVNFVEGPEKNLKITVKDDLDIFKELLSVD